MISPSICKEWIKTPTINPQTHRKISPQGKIYKKFEKDCTKKKLFSPVQQSPPRPSWDRSGVARKVCEEWLKTPDINPRTKRRIKNNGLVYKNLKDECSDLENQKKSKTSKNRVQSPKTAEDRKTSRSILPPSAVTIKKKKLPLLMLQYLKRSFLINNGNYDSRITIGGRVIQNLNEINADQWTMCMTGSKSSEFKNYFKDIIEIGKGTFGQIYLATLNSEKIIVKEANLSRSEEIVLRKNVFLKDKSLEELIEKRKKNIFPREHKNLNYVNELLLSKKCPNFLYTYKMALCDGCKVLGLFSKKPSVRACYVTFMEPADFDLTSVERINVNQQFSIFYQLLCSVYSIHHYYAMYHTDIKSHNILVKRIKPGGCFKYVIGNKTCYVENAGLLIFLADFGVALSLSPKYSSLGFYGTRNAEVVESSLATRRSANWKPFETKYFADYDNFPITRPSLSKAIYIKWIDDNNKIIPGTFNKFGKTKIFPNISVDLYDNRRFPCFEFFNDIQDAIRTFIGGKQMFQDGTHPGISNLHKDFKIVLKKFGFLKYQETMYYINGSVKYVLAEEMLWELYMDPQKIDYIIDTYNL
jgi:hypothetical protein